MNIIVECNKSASVFVCGDILNMVNNGLICSSELSKIISSADYSVCNFEAPVEGFGSSAIKPGVNLAQKQGTIEVLKRQGFNLLLLANNHMMDFGSQALDATLKIAEKNIIETIGAGLEAKVVYRPLIKTINGLKIGMLNACEAQFGEIEDIEKDGEPGYAWINHSVIERNIIKCKKECDFVIVFSHAGLEHYPIPQKEWREKYRHFCKLGADIIIGSHPHVPQGFERYGESWIFYSLGNFYFEINSSVTRENNSFAVILNLIKGKEVDFKLIHHYTKNNRVELAPPEKEIDIAKLNSFLGVDYLAEHDKMIMEEYRKLKKLMAISVFLPVPFNGSFKSFIHMFLSNIMKRGQVRFKDLFILHLLKNETYHYVIKNGLEIIMKRKYNKKILK